MQKKITDVQFDLEGIKGFHKITFKDNTNIILQECDILGRTRPAVGYYAISCELICNKTDFGGISVHRKCIKPGKTDTVCMENKFYFRKYMVSNLCPKHR